MPEWTGERHHWACLMANQPRVVTAPPCVCGHAKATHEFGPCGIETCPCNRYTRWGERT